MKPSISASDPLPATAKNPSSGRGRLVSLEMGATALIVLLLLAWGAYIWPTWLSDPDLSHGLLVPLVFLYLIRESGRREGLPLNLWGRWTLALGVLLLGGAVAGLFLACLIAAALAWTNALVAFLMAASLSLFLLGALLCAAGNPRFPFRVRLNWPAIVACLVWVLSSPIPPGTYTRLTSTLQLGVTRTVLGTLHLLGVPAQQNGNILVLANTTVGVEEACSGVRSLLACIFVGVFLSAVLLQRSRDRIALIVAAPVLAIVMNLVRSLGLTLLANAGVKVEGLIHDATGFGILAVTALLLIAIARRWADQAPTHEEGTREKHPLHGDGFERGASPLVARGGASAVAAFAGAGVAIVSMFGWLTQPAPRHAQPAPDLLAKLPAHPAGWRVDTARDLYRFSATLQTPYLAQRTYVRQNGSETQQITVYLAYWLPGHAPVSLVASHTPDACWPGAGWKPVPGENRRLNVHAEGRVLPVGEYRQFQQGVYPQYVWFWHLYRGRPVAEVDSFSPLEMMRLVVHYGVRSEGDQLFVRISSNTPWNQVEREPVMREILANLQPLGLL